MRSPTRMTRGCDRRPSPGGAWWTCLTARRGAEAGGGGRRALPPPLSLRLFPHLVLDGLVANGRAGHAAFPVLLHCRWRQALLPPCCFYGDGAKPFGHFGFNVIVAAAGGKKTDSGLAGFVKGR
mmetsp:Transcript_9544/g.13426  ORF Transcript_9544/g.13426 Transcript_9544/m.13426 type:complete len:124 (-) Transcript_9544:216-587(-)